MKRLLIGLVVVLCIVAVGYNAYRSEEQTTTGKRKVYAVLPLTGIYSQIGNEQKDTLSIYIEKNKDLPFELEFFDNESNPTKSLNIAQMVSMKDKTPLFVCSIGALCRPILPLLKGMNGFMILSPSSQAEKTPVKEFQRISIDYEEMNNPHIDYLEEGRNVVIIHSNEEAGYKGARLVTSKLKEKGVNIIDTLDFVPSDLDMRILVLKALKNNPDAILIVASPTVGFINLIKVLKGEQDYQGDVLCDPGMSVPSVISSFGKEANGLLVPIFPLKRIYDEHSDIAEALKSEKLELSNSPIMIWDVMDIIRYFIDNKIAFSQDAFVKMGKWHGISTDVVFLPEGNSSYRYILSRVKDGQFIPVDKSEEK